MGTVWFVVIVFHCFKNQNHLCLKTAHQFFLYIKLGEPFLINYHLNFYFVIITTFKGVIRIHFRKEESLRNKNC